MTLYKLIHKFTDIKIPILIQEITWVYTITMLIYTIITQKIHDLR